ncbi:NAD(P)-dependent oxidoreductase, partial [Acidovorax sp.]|uniref:NAD(P)-dependent oxidoreductase n=1 Tax=Acidovorax sp. TaxID=1872122 RepID=UPI0025C3B7C8
MTTTPLRIAVLGIGMMGLPMARRLSEAGHPVRAWNRTRAKAEPLASYGVTVSNTPAEAVQDADIVISLLENGPVVGQVLFDQGAARAMRRGSLFIDMASIQPSEARDPYPPQGAQGRSPQGPPRNRRARGRPAGHPAQKVGR